MTIPGRDIPDEELDLELSTTGVAADSGEAPVSSRVVGEGERTPQDPTDLWHRSVDEILTGQDRSRLERINPRNLGPGAFSAPGEHSTPLTHTRMVNGFAVPDINPQAFTPENFTPPTGEPSPEVQAQLDQLDAWTAVGVVQMGMSPETARLTARRLASMSKEYPWIADVINSDFETAAAMSGADAIAAKFLPNFNMSEELFNVAASMYFEAKEQYETVAELDAFADAERQGNWNIEDAQPEDLTEGLTRSTYRPTAGGYREAMPNLQDLYHDSEINTEAQGFLDELRHSEVDNVGVDFFTDAGKLTATVEYIDGETVEIEVDLDDGTEITSENALREIFLATQGLAHTVTKDGDLRGPQTLLGQGFELVGDSWRLYDRHNGVVNGILGNVSNFLRDDDDYLVDWRSSAERYAEQNEAFIDTQVQAITESIDRDDIMIAATEQALIEQGPDNLVLAAGNNVQWVNAMDEQQFEEIRAEMINEDELREALQSQVDDRTSIKRVLDDSIMQLADFGAAYDEMLHWAGTHSLAFGDFVFDSFSSGDIAEGYEKFQAAWQRANESDTLSEYWGWDGAGATWLDFSASIVLDPFTWVTPGGKGLLQTAYKRLATRAGAREALNLASTKRIAHMVTDALVGVEVSDDVARSIVGATTREAYDALNTGLPRRLADDLVNATSVGDVRQSLYKGDLMQVAALTYGMSAREKLRILEATSYDQVMTAFKQALPANGGTWLMKFDGHVALRNTALNISEASRLYSALPKKAQNWYRRSFGTYRTERYVGLGNLDFMNDAESMIIAAFHDAPDEAAKWMEDLWRTYRDFDQPYEYGQRALLGEADALKSQLNDTVKATPKDVRRFGSLREQTLRTEQRIREIDNRLSTAVGDEAATLTRERRIITEGADALKELRKRRTKITNKPVAKRTQRDLDNLEAIKAQEAEIRKVGVLKADSQSAWFGDMATQYDTYVAATQKTRKQLERARRLARGVVTPGNRDLLADYMDRLMEALGDHLKLPANPNKTTSIGGLKVHDWTGVVGDDAADWGGGLAKSEADDLARNLEALASVTDPATGQQVIDQDLLKKLKAAGYGSKQGAYKLPASGMEIVAYKADASAPWLDRLGNTGQRIQDSLSFAQRVWVSAVLMNPRTIVRSNLDEPLRHMINHGVIGRTRNRAIGIGGEFGDELATGNIAGGLQSSVDQLLPGKLKRLVGSDPDLANDLAAGFAREMNQPAGFNRGTASGYRVVEPGERKAFLEAGRFWVNGFVKNDPMIAGVWKAIDAGDPSVFFQWWDRMGHQLKRQPHFKLADGTVSKITPQAAYEAGEQTLDMLVAHWPSELQGQARRALLRAAQTGNDLKPSLLRKINKPLPGPVAEEASGVMGKAFENFYGAPGARRGSLFAQAQMAENLEILWDAAESNGKLLTSKRLAELTGVSQDEAARWLSSASWEIEYLVNKGGFLRPQQLVEQAYRHARDYSNNIMYQTGAGSLFGKKFAKAYPFGRAQLDYNTFFAQKMTDTLEFGMNPTVARTMATVRHPVRTAQALVTPGARVADEVPLGKLGQTWQPSVAGRPIPFNARVVGRYAALFGAGSTQVKKQQDADPDARIEPEGPLGLIDQASFIPMFPNETMLIDVGPGLGPMWSGALHFLPTMAGDDDSVWTKALAGVRDFAEALHPALEFDSREYDISSPQDIAGAAYKFFVPDSSSSLRGSVENGLLALSSATNMNYEQLQTMLGIAGRPSGWRRTWKSNMGAAIEELFADGGFPILNHPDSDSLLAGILNDTLRATSQEGLEQSANKNWLFWGDIDEFDNQYSEHYNALVEELDDIHASGLIGDSEADRLRELQLATMEEGATTQDYIDFADASADLLFRLGREDPIAQALVIAEHPGLAVNLVSGSQCKISNGRPTGPAEYCEADGRLNLPPGETGRTVLQQGRDEGWIEGRSEADVFDDVLVKLGTVFRRASTALWTATTGDANWRGGSDNQSFPKFLKETTYQVNDGMMEVAETLGIDLESRMTGAEIADAIDMRRTVWASNVAPFAGIQEPAISELQQNSLNRQDDDGAAFVQGLDQLDKLLTDLELSFEELPNDAQSEVRDDFRKMINRGLMSQEAYDRDMARYYGALDYAVPDPPTIQGADEAIAISRGDLEVIDGDTLRARIGGEEVRVRLIGINAADYHSTDEERNAAALEHRDNLASILDGADEIHFGIWEADQFGTIRSEGGGEVRYLLWLYVDGEAVFNPEAFTFRNPTGVSSTGTGVPVPEMGEVI